MCLFQSCLNCSMQAEYLCPSRVGNHSRLQSTRSRMAVPHTCQYLASKIDIDCPSPMVISCAEDTVVYSVCAVSGDPQLVVNLPELGDVTFTEYCDRVARSSIGIEFNLYPHGLGSMVPSRLSQHYRRLYGLLDRSQHARESLSTRRFTQSRNPSSAPAAYRANNPSTTGTALFTRTLAFPNSYLPASVANRIRLLASSGEDLPLDLPLL